MLKYFKKKQPRKGKGEPGEGRRGGRRAHIPRHDSKETRKEGSSYVIIL